MHETTRATVHNTHQYQDEPVSMLDCTAHVIDTSQYHFSVTVRTHK